MSHTIQGMPRARRYELDSYHGPDGVALAQALWELSIVSQRWKASTQKRCGHQIRSLVPTEVSNY